MATGIISLLTALLGLLFWWLKQRAAAANDPVTQNEKRYEQIDEDVSRAVTSTATKESVAHATADLDELERLQRAKGGGDQRGPK